MTAIAWIENGPPGASVSDVGAKMARLAELHTLGVRVPRGYSLTVQAFREHFARSGLAELVEDQLGALDADSDDASIRAATVHIESAFVSTPIEDALAAQIREAYDELSFRCRQVNVPVAVRSSAIGEDSAVASFAGIYETYLGVCGATHVLESVQRCWASMFSPRAVHYRLTHGLSHTDTPMAVGVMELVPAVVAGVAFSIHPVTGRGDRIVIEANFGWGESIVQGAVTPDHVEVDKTDLRMLRYDTGDKAVVAAYVESMDRINLIPMPARFCTERALTGDQIDAIADTVVAIEDHYQHSVDVEWVIDRSWRAGDQIYIVQARPAAGSPGRSDQDESGWNPASYVFGS